ncbi:MAG: P-loop NTPase [Candidatus Micrarchaeaceae archaeon]
MKTIILSSIKGGTGKSLISLNLAYQLSHKYKTGLLDADLDSPYFPYLSKAQSELVATKDVIVPLEWEGLKVVSFGNLFKGKAISIEGKSAWEIIVELKDRVKWGDLDYLVIDMPAGSSDVFKAVVTSFKDISGGFIVMIPASNTSVENLVKLHSLYDIPVLGIVENMAYVSCGDTQIFPFGEPKGKELAEKYGVNYFGPLPIMPEMPKLIEQGKPFIDPELLSGMVAAAEQSEVKKKDWLSVKDYVKSKMEQLIANLLIMANREFDIKGIQEKYGFVQNVPFAFIIYGADGKPLVSSVFRVKDGKLLLVTKPTDVRFVIETDVKTAVSALLGYYKVGDKRIPFDIQEAFTTGKLKVTGPGFLPLFKVVATEFFNDPAVREKIKQYESLLEKL